MPKPWHGSYARFIGSVLDGTCKPMRLREQDGEYEEWPEHVIPVGGLYLSAVSTDPGLAQASGGLGYGSWSRYAQGRCVVGVDDGDSDWAAGNTLGAKTATPAGTCTAPTFTGSSVASQAVSAGTPAGSCSAPTFTGAALAAHAHELPIQIPSTTTTRQIASATFGTGTSRIATAVSATGTANTTSAPVALSQATSAGTPSGTVSAPTFTGSALATHAHNVTAAGTCSAPVFTGQSMSVVQPSIAVYVWRRVG